MLPIILSFLIKKNAFVLNSLGAGCIMALHSSHGSYMCDVMMIIGLSLCAYTVKRSIMVATCFYDQL